MIELCYNFRYPSYFSTQWTRALRHADSSGSVSISVPSRVGFKKATVGFCDRALFADPVYRVFLKTVTVCFRSFRVSRDKII